MISLTFISVYQSHASKMIRAEYIASFNIGFNMMEMQQKYSMCVVCNCAQGSLQQQWKTTGTLNWTLEALRLQRSLCITCVLRYWDLVNVSTHRCRDSWPLRSSVAATWPLVSPSLRSGWPWLTYAAASITTTASFRWVIDWFKRKCYVVMIISEVMQQCILARVKNMCTISLSTTNWTRSKVQGVLKRGRYANYRATKASAWGISCHIL